MKGLKRALLGALVLGGASTAADLVWSAWIPSHRAVFGLIHGSLIFLTMGIVLVFPGPPKKVVRGGLTGLLIGFGAAAFFYLIAPLTRGVAAMVLSWILLWVLFGLVTRHLRRRRESLLAAAARGLLAAAISAPVFYWAVSQIWMASNASGPGVLFSLLIWSAAYLPGFLALLLHRKVV